MGLSSGPSIYLQDAGQHQLKGGQGESFNIFSSLPIMACKQKQHYGQNLTPIPVSGVHEMCPLSPAEYVKEPFDDRFAEQCHWVPTVLCL
jgi:hypothetical protein